jgi:isocitrate dehydrogenase (NAD+)
MASRREITLIPGDGIGPEVTAAARAIVDASGAAFDWDVQPAGLAAQASGLPALGPAVFESIGRTGLALKGPTGTPFGTPYRIEVGAHDLDRVLAQRVAGRQAVAHRLGVARDRRQQVVEVVRDPAGELADGLHLLRLPELLLQAALVGDVDGGADDAEHLAGGVGDREGTVADPTFPTVGP